MLIELFANRIAPLVALQRKVYISILRKELPRLLAFSSLASNHLEVSSVPCRHGIRHGHDTKKSGTGTV